jgi:hypothetical protein
MILQLAGINAMTYFGTRVLEEFGMTEEQTLLATSYSVSWAAIAGTFALRNMVRNDRRKTGTAHCSSELPYGQNRPFTRWVEPRLVADDEVGAMLRPHGTAACALLRNKAADSQRPVDDDGG